MPYKTFQTVDKILTARPHSRSINIPALLENAARVRGTSTAGIALEILKRRLGRQKLRSQDYFSLGLYRPDLTKADRDAFASEREITKLNRMLAAPAENAILGVINSKLLTEFLLRGANLPCATSIAVARASAASLPIPVLAGADAVEGFLRRDDLYPIFGKPDASSLGVGAASFIARDGDSLVLGNGTRVPLRKLAEEIALDYPEGYVFQRLLRPHPEVASLIGPVIGTLRVHSLRFADGPAPLYVMLKLPGSGAMVDGALSGKSGAALIEPDSGRIIRAQLLSDPIGQDMVHGHVTGAHLPGALLPDFHRAVDLALNAHRMFQQQGVMGSDVILTESGPVLNELNLNPLAGLVQKAMGRGILNHTFKASYAAALAVHGVTLPIKGVRL